jgi:hypothetical protein
MSSDMNPFQRPKLNMDEQLRVCRNVMGVSALEFQRLALEFREGGLDELASWTTEMVQLLDRHAFWLGKAERDYNDRIRGFEQG